MYRIVRWAGLLIGLGTSVSAAVAQERRYPPEELRAIGKALVDSLIRQYGVVTDSARNADVKTILTSLQRRAGYQEQLTTYVINNREDFNAAAVAGGYVVVFDRTLEVCRQAARQSARGDAQAEERTYRRLLAAILSHELAHHTLGHTRGGYLRGGNPASEREASRQRELAADRVGALYLLWSGWEIQDAMDSHRLLDGLERQSPQAYGLQRMTYFRTHPRSSLREAELEAFRAELKRNQARFDDALALVIGNPPGGGNLAIALLDTVLMDFPYLTEAYHLRGTAYQQKYLNDTPIQSLQLQIALPTYSAYFLPGIRGGAADPALLERARKDLDRAMTLELKAGTVANLALLDLLQGRFASAEQQALRATELDPSSATVLNIYGTVLYHLKKYPQARSAFERARGLPGWANYPPLLFNLGRTLVQLNDPGSRALLEQYLALDKATEWRREAAALLGGGPSQPVVAGPGSGPTGAETAPVVAGLRLGASPREVTATLGTADVRTPGSDGEMWRYERRGVMVFFTPDFRLSMIALYAREAGSLEGLRVGDDAALASTRLGTPTVSNRGDWFFFRGPWSLFVRPQNNAIVMLGIATR